MFYFGQRVFSLYYDDTDSKDHYTIECYSSESNSADYYYAELHCATPQTQHNDNLQYDIQHYNKSNATISLMTLRMTQSVVMLCHADCHFQTFCTHCHYAECSYAGCRYAGWLRGH